MLRHTGFQNPVKAPELVSGEAGRSVLKTVLIRAGMNQTFWELLGEVGKAQHVHENERALCILIHSVILPRTRKDKSKVKGGGQECPPYTGLLSDPRVHGRVE